MLKELAYLISLYRRAHLQDRRLRSHRPKSRHVSVSLSKFPGRGHCFTTHFPSEQSSELMKFPSGPPWPLVASPWRSVSVHLQLIPFSLASKHAHPPSCDVELVVMRRGLSATLMGHGGISVMASCTLARWFSSFPNLNFC